MPILMKRRRKKNNAALPVGKGGVDQTNCGRRSRWNAAALLLGLAIFCLVLGGCGGAGERKKAAAAAAKGWQALQERNPQAAKEYFALALRSDPNSAAANLGMARICDRYLFDNRAGVTFYLRYLDLTKDEATREVETQNMEALEAVSSGRIEDPVSAVEDLLVAANNARANAFNERLSEEYLHQLAGAGTLPDQVMKEFGGFCPGGSPEVVFRQIAPDQQTTTVMIACEGAGADRIYVTLRLQRGRGDLRNSWHLVGYERLSARNT